MNAKQLLSAVTCTHSSLSVQNPRIRVTESLTLPHPHTAQQHQVSFSLALPLPPYCVRPVVTYSNTVVFFARSHRLGHVGAKDAPHNQLKSGDSQ